MSTIPFLECAEIYTKKIGIYSLFCIRRGTKENNLKHLKQFQPNLHQFQPTYTLHLLSAIKHWGLRNPPSCYIVEVSELEQDYWIQLLAAKSHAQAPLVPSQSVLNLRLFMNLKPERWQSYKAKIFQKIYNIYFYFFPLMRI